LTEYRLFQIFASTYWLVLISKNTTKTLPSKQPPTPTELGQSFTSTRLC